MRSQSSRSARVRLIRRRASVQSVGLIVAALLAVVFILLIGFFAMRAPKTVSTPGATASNAPPPDIKSLPTGPGQANILQGEGMFVQLMDKHDPTRLAGVIESSHVEPLEARRYRVDQPKVWIYLKDGKSLLVEAKSGKLYMPDRTKEPEAGTLDGGTVVRLFPRPVEGTKVDPKTDLPLLTARMESISFDGTVGEVSTPEEFLITSDQADFSGRAMRILFNEAAQRIEYFEVRDQGKLVFRPNAKGPRPTPAEKTSTAAATNVPAPAAQRKPVETFYNAVFAENVLVVHDKAQLRSDALQVWARTIDNQLAPGAIASYATSPLNTAPSTPATSTTATPAVADATKPAPAAEDTIVMTWGGMLVLKPAAAAPPELERDQLAVRFESPAAGKVAFSDPAAKAEGRADTIRYGLSTRELRLASTQPRGVNIALENSGSLETRSIGIDLGTGIAHAEGAGVLAGKSRPGDSSEAEQTVTWNEQADFEFLTREGRVTGVVKEAMLAGDVKATDGKGSLKSGFLHASFKPGTASPNKTADASNASRLTRLQAKEGVRADDGSGGALNATDLDVAFREESRGAIPKTLVARGKVVAVRDTSVLQADVLTADFEKPEAGDTKNAGKERSRVASIRADGKVLYKDGNDVTATADQLRADVPKQVADLTGENVTVGKDNSEIVGTQLRLDGLARTMEVFGAGRFEHEQPGHVRPAVATWTKGMTFDDKSGVVVANGDARADSYPDAVTHDSMSAGRVTINITPAGSKPEQTTPGIDSKTERELLKVVATGANLDEAGGAPAKIESTLYDEPQSEKTKPRLLRKLAIVGSTIELAGREQTLTVPVPGQLLVLDRREKKQDSQKDASEDAEPAIARQTPSLGNAKGEALFEWDGTLRMDRTAGSIDMTKDVRLTHLRLGDQQVTTLSCDHLKALMSESASAQNANADNPREVRGQLRSVMADGSVRAVSGPKVLLATRVDYDAFAETMLASAGTDDVVSVVDNQSPTPIQAKELFWDLKADRLEVRKPLPIVAPK